MPIIIINCQDSSWCIHYCTHSFSSPQLTDQSRLDLILASCICNFFFYYTRKHFPIKLFFSIPYYHDWYGTWCFPYLILMTLDIHCGKKMPSRCRDDEENVFLRWRSRRWRTFVRVINVEEGFLWPTNLSFFPSTQPNFVINAQI